MYERFTDRARKVMQLANQEAQRSAMPDELRPQIPIIRRVFEGFNVPVLMHEGMEADDVIATLARRGEERGLDVTICTADKDARQLLDDRIRIYNLRKQQLDLQVNDMLLSQEAEQ